MKIYHKPFTDKVNRYLLIGRSRAIMLFSILLLSSNACFQTEKTLQTKALESKSTITRELELEAQEREVKQSEEFEREKREREREVKEGLEQLKREREAKEKLEQLKRENARAREERARAREERARAREERARARAREMQDLRNAMDRIILEEPINLYLESEDEEITQDQIVEKEKYADEGTVIRIENPIDKECQICCEEFSNTTPRYCFSCCMREDNLKNIDGDCIKRIIDNKPYCPFCRKKLNKEKIRSLLK